MYNVKDITDSHTNDEIIKILENRHHEFINKSNELCIKKIINQFDKKIILHIITKLLHNSKKFKLAIEYIPIICETYLPPEFVIDMEESYKNYRNPDIKYDKTLYDIFNVSKCSNIIKGRARLLYKNIKKDDIESYMSLYKNIEKYYVNKYCINKHNFVKETFCYKDIIGETDGRIDDMLVDYKNSSDKTLKAEYIVQLLCYAHMLRKKNIVINKMAIFNPLLGIFYVADIKNWSKGDELINYLLEIRENIMLRTFNTNN